jgi:hypothetical protein
MSSVFTSSLRRRVLAPCALALVSAIVLSACGSSSTTTSSSASASAAAGGGASSGSSSSTYEARLNYAKCMRSHGVNVPDPSANGGPAGGAGGGGGFRALRSSPNFQSASTACAKYRSKAFGFANISPAQRAQLQQELVKFAECMRSHSIDIPDPSTSGGGGFGIFRSIPSSERNSPAFQTALKACSSSLPRFGRGGAGGGPPAGGGTPGA